MSMLAERKRKQKWCLNPRGKDWAEDSNKFGQKLLEKMGWSKGKGLGVNENGITEHVKVSFKNDNKGIGFKEDANAWTGNEVNFSNLLKDLSSQNQYNPHLGSDGASDNSECNDVLNIQSLEKKSQASRARVHYRKFTRGKDLSRYTTKDLAQIFGKSTLNIKTSTSTGRDKTEEDQVTSTTSYGEADEDINDKKLIVSETNMAEYFQRRTSSRHAKSVSTVTSSDINDNVCPEIDTTTVASTTTDVVTTIASTNSKKPVKTSKRKKKSQTTSNTENAFPDSSQQEPIPESLNDEYCVEMKNECNQDSLDSSMQNATDQLDKVAYYVETNNNAEPFISTAKPVIKLEKIDYYVEMKKDPENEKAHPYDDSLKIKLKKKLTYDNPALNISDTSIDNENNNSNEVVRKSKKKIKGIENPALELSNSDESLTPKKKKRKTTFISYMHTDAENTLTVKSVPRKRKRSETIDNKPGYDNPAFESPFGEMSTPKSQPKKKYKLKGISNPALDASVSPPGIETFKHKGSGMIHVIYKPETYTPKSALRKSSTMIRPRKSVQINESINQEKFITDESENSQGDDDNTSISDRIDNYQNELENSLNEKKCMNGKDHTSKKFKNIALKKLSQRRVSVEFPGVKHETIVHGYGTKN